MLIETGASDVGDAPPSPARAALVAVPDAAAGEGAPGPGDDRSAGRLPGNRLDWLDVLRGIAVLAVVYEHLTDALAPDLKLITVQWAHAGTFGVVLFFLVSGYIVPASLERRGSLRGFWIGRVFRLYPAFLVIIGLAVLADMAGFGWLPGGFRDHPGTTLLGHVTMLQDVLGIESLQIPFWTLSYEMVFYLAVTSAFVFRVNRHSAVIAAGLGILAAAVGGILPERALVTDQVSLQNVTVCVALTMLVGIVAVTWRNRAVVVIGAVVLGAIVLVLLAVNQRSAGWETFILLAIMFTGTAVYRADAGQSRWWVAVAGIVVVLDGVFLAVHRYGGMWHMANVDRFPANRSWLGAVLLAGVVFAAAMLLRRFRFPRWLSGLGVISYSVYLSHQLLIYILWNWLQGYGQAPTGTKLFVLAVFLLALIAVSRVLYTYVEIPFQRLGRRVPGGPRRERPDAPRHPTDRCRLSARRGHIVASHADRGDEHWAVVETNMAWFSSSYTADPARVLDVVMRAAGPHQRLMPRDRPFVRTQAKAHD